MKRLTASLILRNNERFDSPELGRKEQKSETTRDGAQQDQIWLSERPAEQFPEGPEKARD